MTAQYYDESGALIRDWRERRRLAAEERSRRPLRALECGHRTALSADEHNKRAHGDPS